MKLVMVIGSTASGKTTFINDKYCDKDGTVCLNVYDYQTQAYKDAGYMT